MVALKDGRFTAEGPVMSLGAKIRMRSVAGVLAAVVAAAAVGFAGLPAGAASGGSISGRVLDANSTPLGGICVSATGPTSAQTQTDPTGDYSLAGLAAGTYTVQYSDCSPTPQYLTQWYLGHTDQAARTR